jgi:hypothetical protein
MLMLCDCAVHLCERTEQNPYSVFAAAKDDIQEIDVQNALAYSDDELPTSPDLGDMSAVRMSCLLLAVRSAVCLGLYAGNYPLVWFA